MNLKADLLKNVTEAIEEIENGKEIPMEQIVAEMEKHIILENKKCMEKNTLKYVILMV